MDDLTAEFVECVSLDLTADAPSVFTRFTLLCGPPEGVDYYATEVGATMRALSERFPTVPVHEDWPSVWGGE